jgi:hypothetical protein
MKKLLNNIENRFRVSRPGSVLILVVALLVLMALIGTAFLSTTRVDRYATAQHVTNSEIDLLLEGVKNMAKATIVGGLNDPSLPFPYRPAFRNSYTDKAGNVYPSSAKNWDAPDLYHQYTNDPLIGETANDAWLSPRTPTLVPFAWAGTGAAVSPAWQPTVVWPCLGEPLTGNTFESPIVLQAAGPGLPAQGSASYVPPAGQTPPPFTWSDRITSDFVPAFFYNQAAKIQSDEINSAPGPIYDSPGGNRLTPTFLTINYPDGTSQTYPAFTLANIKNTVASPVVQTTTPPGAPPTYQAYNGTSWVRQTPQYFTYLAGDADGDGIADCGLFRLPIGPIDGITYYAGVRIVDNCAAINVNTAMSRRYDYTYAPGATSFAAIAPTRAGAAYTGIFNLSCFESNVGLNELMQSYTGSPGVEFTTWLNFQLGTASAPLGLVEAASGNFVTSTNPAPSSTGTPLDDSGNPRTDFLFTTLGDLLTSQLGRRPTNTGYTQSGVRATSFTDEDAAALSYHFIFDNPNTERTPLETILHYSLSDIAPNSPNVVATYPTSTFITTQYAGPITQSITATNTFNTWMLSYMQGLGSAGSFTLSTYVPPSSTSTSYTGNYNNAAAVVTAWYADNFDWTDDSLSLIEQQINPGSTLGLGESDAGSAYNQKNNNASRSANSTNGGAANQAGWMARSRRSIFTAYSAVSNLAPQPLLPDNGGSGAATSSRPYWVVPQAGGLTLMSPVPSTLCKTSVNTANFQDLWRGFWLSMAGDYGLSPLGSNAGSYSYVGTVGTKIPAATYTVPAGYYDHGLDAGQSIYTGMQFNQLAPADLTNATPPQYSGSQDPAGFTPPQDAEQHPQAMFRSSLRTPTNVFYGPGNNYSYIEPDQMVLLRSAIAAANVEAMRDPTQGSAQNIHTHDLPLVATIHGTPTTVIARVFGVTQQPYITEIYANTDTTTAFPGGTANTLPYVAVELFNPYPNDIDLAGWQLAAIDRSPTSDLNRNILNTSVLYTFQKGDKVPGFMGTASAGSTTQYQGGYTLIDDIGSGGATTRPPSVGTAPGIPPTGPVPAVLGAPTATAPLYYVSVPALSKLIPNSGYANQELVLLRPVAGHVAGAAASPEAPVIDQVPVDSYDFTGLQYGLQDKNSKPIADIWHYARGNTATTGANPSDALWRFIYPGRYDATDPTPYSATASAAAPSVTASPSGRTYASYTYSAFSRRHQGTQAFRYYPSSSFPTNSDTAVMASNNVHVTLGGTSSGNGQPGSGPNDNPQSSYPTSFAFQYLNNGQPGSNPLNTTMNGFPFGQFARNSDMLQVPFVGSYIIFNPASPGTTPSGYPVGALNTSTGVVNLAVNLTAADASQIAEMNAMPIDCAFAEDTDITDDPIADDVSQATGSDQYLWNESVGHFAPVNTGWITNTNNPTAKNPDSSDNTLRSKNSGANWNSTQITQSIADSNPTLANAPPPTSPAGAMQDPCAPYKVPYSTDQPDQKYWRYHWASRLFDYLTVQAPSDDFLPNVQPAIYSNAFPSNLPVAVQNSSAITSGGNSAATPPSYSEDTVPVYGLININTAPWRVLSALRISPYDDGEPNAYSFTIGPPAGSVAFIKGQAAGFPNNSSLAQMIALWRDAGPIDGNGVQLFNNVNNWTPSTAEQPLTAPGVAPPNAAPLQQLNTTTFPYASYKGPFTSITDLLNVPTIQSYIEQSSFLKADPRQNFTVADPEPNDEFGHLAPGTYSAAAGTFLTDGVRNDTDERFDLLHRLSNMITTKSDVYTVYIVVQGWRNAGSTSSTAPPQMVVQKRAAFIIDRTGVTPTSSNVKIINVPTN